MRIIPAALIVVSSVMGMEKSYFYSKEESQILLNNLKPSKPKNFKITGILFIKANKWIVWINDKPYTSLGKYKDFCITKVSSSKVILTTEDGETISLKIKV